MWLVSPLDGVSLDDAPLVHKDLILLKDEAYKTWCVINIRLTDIRTGSIAHTANTGVKEF